MKFAFQCLLSFCIFATGSSSLMHAQQARVVGPVGTAILKFVGDDDLEHAFNEFGRVVDQNWTIKRIEEERIPAAAGGMYRALVQLSSERQYEWLEAWSMPTAGRKTVRILTVPVPHDAPPKAFARQIGQRPRDDSFAVAQIAGYPGLYCSGWHLVQVADELGRLSRLMAQLQSLHEQKVPGAAELLALVIAKSTRGPSDALAKTLTEATSSPGESISQTDLAHAAVALAASTKKDLGELAIKTLEHLAETRRGHRSLLRTAHAVATQNAIGDSDPKGLFDNSFHHWAAVAGGTAGDRDRGQPAAMWLTLEDHLLHVAGGTDDVLFLRYPIAGEFDFICETQTGGAVGTDGGLTYGGLHFEPIARDDRLIVSDSNSMHRSDLFCPFMRHEIEPTFNRVSIRGADGKTAMETNFHPMHVFDTDASNSPWLGLRSRGDHRPVFRNLRMSGSPTIPRSVPMTGKDSLPGWSQSYFSDSADWSVAAGVLTANVEPDAGQRSWIRYERPLLENETVTYQFKYGEGDAAVHPSVGRMVFLLEAGGVRVRWITDDQVDWTGLEPDHALLEPLSRRGPKPFPFRSNAWNDVSVERSGNNVDIRLNGEIVYHREFDFGGDRRFGLYSDQASDVQVRDAKLSGDWPEELPADLFERPFSSLSDDTDQQQKELSYRTIGPTTLASNGVGIRRTMQSMEAEEQFDRLMRWVMPNVDHPDVRMSSFLLPTRAALLQRRDPAFAPHSLRPNLQIPDSDAVMRSPAIDLIRLAALLSRTDELTAAIDALDANAYESAQWYKWATTCLLACERSDRLTVEACLVSMMGTDGIETIPIESHLTVVRAVATAFVELPVTLDYVNTVESHLVKNGNDEDHLGPRTHLSRIAAEVAAHQQADSMTAPVIDELPGGLIGAFNADAETQGQGRSVAVWRANRAGEIHHVVGHRHDRLLVPTPMIGDCAVEAEIGSWSSTAVLMRGSTIEPDPSKDRYRRGILNGNSKDFAITPPMQKTGPWIRFRQTVRGGKSLTFVNGRSIDRHDVEANADPWLGFQSWWTGSGRVRALSITGELKVPSEVTISASPHREGWTSYFDQGMPEKMPGWWIKPGENPSLHTILGPRSELPAGSAAQRLLRYHRPLSESTSVRFQFFYEPDMTTASPAIGRLALLITPRGIAEHWITDDRFDPTHSRPDNEELVPSDQLASAGPLLKHGDWNEMQVRCDAGFVTLSINGRSVYRRSLDGCDDRTFGLFYFADQSELKVRDVVMSGDWPNSIPDSSIWVDESIEMLDQTRAELAGQFDHSFDGRGDGDRYIQAQKGGSPYQDTNQVPDPSNPGRSITSFAIGKWSQFGIIPQFSLRGDFDIEATISDLSIAGNLKDAGARIVVGLDDEFSRELTTALGVQGSKPGIVRGGTTITYPDGTRQYQSERYVDESTGGRLRVARRGDQAYFLFAQGDSSQYKLLARYEASIADVPIGSIKLLVVASGQGQASVTWNDLSIRAERILTTQSPESDIKAIAVVDFKTEDIRTLARGSAELANVGSPQWSPDQRYIAYDQSSGSTTNSRMMIVPTDGGPAIDRGGGTMPNYSPDGSLLAITVAGEGVGFMDTDGSDRTMIDARGWGMQWSPDPNVIGYGKSGNVYLYDVKRQTTTPLMTGTAAARYNWLHWNMGWSRNGRKIVFKGRRADGGGDEVAVVSLDRPDRLTVLLRDPKRLSVNFSWSADDRSILVVMQPDGFKEPTLVQLSPDGTEQPEVLQIPDVDGKVIAAVWSPDGTKLALVVQPQPELVDLMNLPLP